MRPDAAKEGAAARRHRLDHFPRQVELVILGVDPAVGIEDRHARLPLVGPGHAGVDYRLREDQHGAGGAGVMLEQRRVLVDGGRQ